MHTSPTAAAPAVTGRRIRSRLTYANVMATIAVFIALGGTAWAAATIGSAQIIDNSVRGVDIKESSLAKVPNADKLDGRNSTAFLLASQPKTYATSSLVSTSSTPATNWDQVLTLTSIPAGSYLVNGFASITSDQSGVRECDIFTTGSATKMAKQYGTLNQYANVAVSGTITLATAGSVVLECTAMAGAWTAEARSLTATRISTLTTQ